MWDKAACCIKETAREVLGVSKSYSGQYRGEWWWNREVKKKMETKKVAYAKLAESKDEKQQRGNREKDKLSRKEAKLTVTVAKTIIFESLYVGLEKRSGEKRLFRLAKARERKGCDLDQVKCIMGKDDTIFVEDVHIKRRCQLYFHRLLNEE